MPPSTSCAIWDITGTWRLEPTYKLVEAIRQEQFRRALVPPLVHAMIKARIAKLSQSAHLLVMACAVLGNRACAQLLWQVAELGVQAGIEGLEEAVKSGMLREEATGSQLGSYSFPYELMREVVYTELGVARRHVLHQRVLTHSLAFPTARRKQPDDASSSFTRASKK